MGLLEAMYWICLKQTLKYILTGCISLSDQLGNFNKTDENAELFDSCLKNMKDGKTFLFGLFN